MLQSCFLHRIEHEAFSGKDSEAFRQLVRVVVRDFLPFVKRTFTNLYSEVKVQELARSTPCALWQQSTSHAPMAHKAAISLHMDLVVEKIVEPLRTVAPRVFEELETLEQQRRLQEQQLVAAREEGVATREKGVAMRKEGVAMGEEEIASREEAAARKEEVATREEGVATREEGVAAREEGVAARKEGVATRMSVEDRKDGEEGQAGDEVEEETPLLPGELTVP